MSTVMEIFKWLLENWSQLISAIIALMMAVIAFLMIIPGNQGEVILQKIVDFLKKITFNKKK